MHFLVGNLWVGLGAGFVSGFKTGVDSGFGSGAGSGGLGIAPGQAMYNVAPCLSPSTQI